MQGVKLCLGITLSALLISSTALAGKTSIEYGETLFNDPTFAGSTNDKSCSSCHANGSGLEESAANPKLAQLIDKCITGPMEAQKIDGRSAEIRSLKLYVKELTPSKE